MKSKILSLLVLVSSMLISNNIIGQENDDMYFSRKDRDKLYASMTSTNQSYSLNSGSEYSNNHNFNSPTIRSTTAGSPTVQTNGKEEDANNQYFIKDYSIKNKTDNEIKTYAGINSNHGFHSGFNIMLSFGSYYRYPYFGSYYNPFNDPFSPYYDPFYRYYDPWYYTSYRYDPWRYYRSNRYRYNWSYYNSVSCFYPTNGYTNYSSNVRNEVKYRNGRKVISGSRTSRSINRTTENPNRGRAILNRESEVSTNGRSSTTTGSRNTYRKHLTNNQNVKGYKSNTKRSSSYNRTNNKSNRTNWNRNSSSNNSNRYRSSGSSSGSRSKISSGSRSGRSSTKPSSSGSKGKGRSRDN